MIDYPAEAQPTWTRQVSGYIRVRNPSALKVEELGRAEFCDGLRAVAAFCVLISHCMIWSGWREFNWPLVPSPGVTAKMAVDLFMILSGFLMTFNASARADREPMLRLRSWLNFYVRRFFRIAPAYYVSLGLAVLAAVPFLGGYAILAHRIPWLRDSIYNAQAIDYSLTNLALHFSFVFGTLPSWTFSTQLPDWSLSLEMQFYALFPLITVIMTRFGVLSVSALLLIICLYGTSVLASAFAEPSLIVFKLPVFLSGMLLCHASIVRSSWRKLGYLCGALLLPISQMHFYGRAAVWISVIVLLIAALTSGHANHGMLRYVRLCLGSKVATLFADLSYSTYLFHGFFIGIVGGMLYSCDVFVSLASWLRVTILFIIVLFGTAAVACLIHRYIERPGIQLGRRIIELSMSTARSKHRRNAGAFG